jgi:hypothetical protein
MFHPGRWQIRRSFADLGGLMSRHRSTLSLSSLCLAFVLAAPAAAHPYATDQQCMPEAMGSYNVRLMGPLAQEFVPTFDRLDVVVLVLEHSPSSSAPSAGVRVRVHADSLGGALLGESVTVSVPRGAFGETHFDFSPPVTLTPGATHVIEIQQPDTQGEVMAWTSNFDAYAQGRAFLLGTPVAGLDFLFRTGLDPALPVERPSWGALKTRWR